MHSRLVPLSDYDRARKFSVVCNGTKRVLKPDLFIPTMAAKDTKVHHQRGGYGRYCAQATFTTHRRGVSQRGGGVRGDEKYGGAPTVLSPYRIDIQQRVGGGEFRYGAPFGASLRKGGGAQRVKMAGGRNEYHQMQLIHLMNTYFPRQTIKVKPAKQVTYNWSVILLNVVK